jgi:hypothetical protein
MYQFWRRRRRSERRRRKRRWRRSISQHNALPTKRSTFVAFSFLLRLVFEL